MKIKTKLMTIGVLLVFFLSGCATQKDMTSVDTRLTEMELRNAEARKNRDDIKYQVDEYSKMRENMDRELRRQSASLRALIEELREEIRILNGRLEEYDFALKQQQKGVDSFQSKNETVSNQLMETTTKNDQRIARLENYLNLESAGKPTKVVPVVTPPAQAKASKKNGEEEIYKLGKQAFDQGDSDTAKKHFQELIKRFPKSENADNAQFWIGEIYYREKWYEKAILEYQNVIEKFPKGNKVPAALLKQGLAFQNIGDKANSRLILEELIKKYPKTNEAKIAREKIKE
jgi:tol-pal system protein YbgF